MKAIVVGWSAGGVIALEAAGRAPGLVSRLVLLEPPLHAKRHPRPSMIAAIAGATIMGRTGRSQAGARRFLRWALHRNDGRSDFDAMPPWWHDRLAGPDGAAVVAELGLGTGEHLGPGFFEQITAPVALLHGDQSRRAFVDAAQRAASLVPDATVAEVHGTGHAIQLQAPEAVVDVVAQEGTNSSNRPRSRKPTEA